MQSDFMFYPYPGQSVENMLMKKSPLEILSFLIQNKKSEMIIDYFRMHPETFIGCDLHFDDCPIVFSLMNRSSFATFRNCIKANILEPTLKDGKENTWAHHCAFICSFSTISKSKSLIDIIIDFVPEQINELNVEGKTPMDVFVGNRRYNREWKGIFEYMKEKKFVFEKYKNAKLDVDKIEDEFDKYDREEERKEYIEEKKKREERLEASHAQFERDSAQIRQNVQMKWGSILRQREREKREREQELQREQERKMELFRKEEKLRKEIEKRAKREQEEMEKIRKEPPPIHSTLRNLFFDRRVDESVFCMESE